MKIACQPLRMCRLKYVVPSLCLYLISGGIMASAATCDVKKNEVAAGAWIAPEVTANKLPLSIMEVKSNQPMKLLLDEFVEKWKKEGAKTRQYDAAGWKVAGALYGDCFYTLQLIEDATKGAKSYGYLSASKLNQMSKSYDKFKNLPVLAGAEVVSDVESNDSGKLGRTIVLTSTTSPLKVNDYYVTQLYKEGWGFSANQTQMLDKSNSVHLIVAKKAGVEVDMVIAEAEGKTVITAVMTDKP